MQIYASTYKSALWVLTGLTLLVLVGVVVFLKDPDFPFLSYVGGISTLAVALLTVAYVITTSGQLSVMNAQLEQMQRSRDFQAQPLPVIKITKIEIEKPRFEYTPPEDEYKALGRVRVYFIIENKGTHPAINVVSSGQIIIPLKSGSRTLVSASVISEVIPESGVFPDPEESKDFMFTGDKNAEFMDALRYRDFNKQPIFMARTIFRNALGSCFAATSHFKVSIPDVETEAKLTTWHSALVTFPVQFKAEIEHLRKIRRKNNGEWNKLFDEVKKRFEKPLTDVKNIELRYIVIPLSFSIEPLKEESYEKEVKKKYFGSPIPHWIDECLHSN